MATDDRRHHPGDGAIDSWLVSAGRDRRPGAPLNVPPFPASNFVLGTHRAYARDDGTPGWEALEEIVGGLEGGSSVAFASGMAGIAAVFDDLATGAVVALPDDCYQGVAALAAAGERRGRWCRHDRGSGAFPSRRTDRPHHRVSPSARWWGELAQLP